MLWPFLLFFFFGGGGMGLVGVTNVECLSVIDSSFLFPFRLLFFLSFPGVRSSCIFQCFICLLVFFFLKKTRKNNTKSLYVHFCFSIFVFTNSSLAKRSIRLWLGLAVLGAFCPGSLELATGYFCMHIDIFLFPMEWAIFVCCHLLAEYIEQNISPVLQGVVFLNLYG